MTYRPNEVFGAFLEEMGLPFASSSPGELSYLIMAGRHTVHAILREVVVTPSERDLDRGRGRLRTTRGRRMRDIIRATEVTHDTPSLLVLTSHDPSDLEDAAFFVREGLYGSWRVEDPSSSRHVRTALDACERRPSCPSAVAILDSRDAVRLDVYHNRYAIQPIDLEALAHAEVRQFCLGEDANGLVGWDRAEVL